MWEGLPILFNSSFPGSTQQSWAPNTCMEALPCSTTAPSWAKPLEYCQRIPLPEQGSAAALLMSGFFHKPEFWLTASTDCTLSICPWGIQIYPASGRKHRKHISGIRNTVLCLHTLRCVLTCWAGTPFRNLILCKPAQSEVSPSSQKKASPLTHSGPLRLKGKLNK